MAGTREGERERGAPGRASASAAGALSSSADDLSAFYQALFEHPLLAPTPLAERTAWTTPDSTVPGRRWMTERG
ncbi:MAG: hypothetical protein EOO72_01000 [Myxococcaceae bacterium]|nr:MAG: hypothetical protein EOO72_01000 [Myxococcaceae bacterium]